MDENTGSYKFRDFLRDERKMAKLFEDFVSNFFRIESSEFAVKKERIYWAASSETDPNLQLLPTMETDISLRDEERTIIIDTKYYKDTLELLNNKNEKLHVFPTNQYYQSVEPFK